MIPIVAINSRVTTALVVGGGLAVFGALLIATASSELRGRRKAKVPIGYRPAASDEELESRFIVKVLTWSALFTILMALWLPAYWLREPSRLASKRTALQLLAVNQGRDLYRGTESTPGLCAQCHGMNGEGLPRTVNINGAEVSYTEPPLKYMYSRYKAAGRNEDEVTQLIYDAINRGRPGTPMPTWALAFGGPLNSVQVDDVVQYLRSIQEVFPAPEAGATGAQLFAANCAICHGRQGAVRADGTYPVMGTGVDDQGHLMPGPNLSIALQRLTPDQLRDTIMNGRLNTNRYSMPSWAALGNDAVDALVQFIESIQRSK